MLNKPVSLVVALSQTGSLQKPLLPDSLALTQNLYHVNGYRPGISFVNSVSSFEFMVHFETCLPRDSSKLINSCQTKPQDIYPKLFKYDIFCHEQLVKNQILVQCTANIMYCSCKRVFSFIKFVHRSRALLLLL